MKSEFRIYRTDSAKLEEQLGPEEKEILEKFMTYCAMSAGVPKLRNYRRYLLQFRDTVEKPLDRLTKDDVIAFWALVNHSAYETNTKVSLRRTVKRFLKWHYRDLDMVEPLKTGSFVLNHRIDRTSLITPEELRSMIHAAESIRDKTLIVLLYETGARPQEVRRLQADHWR